MRDCKEIDYNELERRTVADVIAAHKPDVDSIVDDVAKNAYLSFLDVRDVRVVSNSYGSIPDGVYVSKIKNSEKLGKRKHANLVFTLLLLLVVSITFAALCFLYLMLHPDSVILP